LVVQECGFLFILGREACPPAVWLRALSKMTLTNESAPIPHNSPKILMKSQKMCRTGRLLHGHSREFVRMRRTGAIPHIMFGRRVVPRPLRPDITYQPRTHDTDPISTPTSKFQQPGIYRQAIKPRNSGTTSTLGHNRHRWVQLRGKNRPPRAIIMGSPPIIADPFVIFRHGLLCPNLTHL
jgi:hypothetical protein